MIGPDGDGARALAVLRGLRVHLVHHPEASTTLMQWFELRNGTPVGWHNVVTSCCQQLLKHAEQVCGII